MSTLARRALPSALCVVLLTGCGMLPGLGPPEAEGPRRVAAERRDAPSEGGAPDSPSHHWVGLREAWHVPQTDQAPHRYGLVSDGERFVALRKEIEGGPDAELTGYDGATGKRLWRTRLPWTENASPVAVGQTAVVTTGEKRTEYVAIDTVTGEERWRAPGGEKTFPVRLGLPAFASGAILDGVFYHADGPRLVGRDLVTGKVRYRRTSTSHLATAGPVAAGDRIAVAVRPDMIRAADGIDDYTLRSVAVLDKKLKPVRQIDFPEAEEIDQLEAGGDIVVAAGGGDPGRVFAVDATTGEKLWDQPLPRTVEVGPPVGEVLPLRDHEQRFIGHDILTGERLWTLGTRQGDDQSARSRVMGVADGTLFGLGRGVEIVDARSGEVVFGHQFTPRGGGLVVAAAGRVVIYNHDGLMGFD